MLNIVFQSGRSREWHVGEESPVGYAEVIAISEIQADGHELEHIKNMFDQPILPKGRVVRIFGDLAKTIVANL